VKIGQKRHFTEHSMADRTGEIVIIL